MLLKVHKVTGEYAVSADDGQKVFEVIYPLLAGGVSVDLDFTDVDVIIAKFWAYSVCQLLAHFSPETLNSLVSFKGLTEDDSETLQACIDNAKQHYMSP